MKAVYIIAISMLFLVACVQTTEQVNQTTEVEENATVEVNESANITIEQNLSVQMNETENISEEENVSNEPAENETVEALMAQELSISQQYKMTPLLESAVMNSSCYKITWQDIEKQDEIWPIEVKKEIQFKYEGGQSFKGWIVSTLFLARLKLDSQTVVVMVDNMTVTCPGAENFPIDWDYAYAKLKH